MLIEPNPMILAYVDDKATGVPVIFTVHMLLAFGALAVEGAFLPSSLNVPSLLSVGRRPKDPCKSFVFHFVKGMMVDPEASTL